jgi:hypothetical protein
MTDIDSWLGDNPTAISTEAANKAEEDYRWNRSDIAYAESKKRDCVIVRPKPNELFIDIDSKAQMETFEKSIELFKRVHPVSATHVSPSPSGKPGRYHIIVVLESEKVDAKTRILYQAVLGSDPIREVLSLMRLDKDDHMPTIFFELANGRSCTCNSIPKAIVGDHHTTACSMYDNRDGLG